MSCILTIDPLYLENAPLIAQATSGFVFYAKSWARKSWFGKLPARVIMLFIIFLGHWKKESKRKFQKRLGSQSLAMFQTGVFFLGCPVGKLISRKILVVKCLQMGLRYLIELQWITSQNTTQEHFNSLRTYIKYFFKRMLKFFNPMAVNMQAVPLTVLSVTPSACEISFKRQECFSNFQHIFLQASS